MQMVWNALRAALQLIKLRDLASVLPGFVARIAKSNGRPSGQRQRERMGLLPSRVLVELQTRMLDPLYAEHPELDPKSPTYG
jgi:hypothetical protein